MFLRLAEGSKVDSCSASRDASRDRWGRPARRSSQLSEYGVSLLGVGMVEATRVTGGKRTVEGRYYLSSLTLDVATLARAVHGHWGIENKLRWLLDVWFRENHSRARTGHAAENLATLCRLALNLLKQERTKKRGIKGKQLNAG